MTTGCELIRCSFFKDGKCTDEDSQFEQRCRYNSPEEQRADSHAEAEFAAERAIAARENYQRAKRELLNTLKTLLSCSSPDSAARKCFEELSHIVDVL